MAAVPSAAKVLTIGIIRLRRGKSPMLRSTSACNANVRVNELSSRNRSKRKSIAAARCDPDSDSLPMTMIRFHRTRRSVALIASRSRFFRDRARLAGSLRASSRNARDAGSATAASLSATRAMISAAFTMLRNSKLRAASVGPEQGRIPRQKSFRGSNISPVGVSGIH